MPPTPNTSPPPGSSCVYVNGSHASHPPSFPFSVSSFREWTSPQGLMCAFVYVCVCVCVAARLFLPLTFYGMKKKTVHPASFHSLEKRWAKGNMLYDRSLTSQNTEKKRYCCCVMVALTQFSQQTLIFKNYHRVYKIKMWQIKRYIRQ